MCFQCHGQLKIRADFGRQSLWAACGCTVDEQIELRADLAARIKQREQTEDPAVADAHSHSDGYAYGITEGMRRALAVVSP